MKKINLRLPARAQPPSSLQRHRPPNPSQHPFPLLSRTKFIAMPISPPLTPLEIPSRDHSIENDLPNHLRDLNIGDADTHQFDLDQYVTQETINRAFEGMISCYRFRYRLLTFL